MKVYHSVVRGSIGEASGIFGLVVDQSEQAYLKTPPKPAQAVLLGHRANERDSMRLTAQIKASQRLRFFLRIDTFFESSVAVTASSKRTLVSSRCTDHLTTGQQVGEAQEISASQSNKSRRFAMHVDPTSDTTWRNPFTPSIPACCISVTSDAFMLFGT